MGAFVSYEEKFMKMLECQIPGDRDFIKTILGKGLKRELRGRYWMHVTGAEERRSASEIEYSLIFIEEDEDFICIQLDLPRVCKELVYRESVRRVIERFLKSDIEVRYVSPLMFIVCELLKVVDEESTFWIFIQIMQAYHWKYFIYPKAMEKCSLNALLADLDQQVSVRIPKIHKHFKGMEIKSELFASTSILTLFTHNTPEETSHHILDAFFIFGPGFLIKIWLVLISSYSAQLLNSDQQSTLTLLLELPKHLTPHFVISIIKSY